MDAHVVRPACGSRWRGLVGDVIARTRRREVEFDTTAKAPRVHARDVGRIEV